MLNKIILQQKKDVHQLQTDFPFQEFGTRLNNRTRDFYSALEGGLSYLFECKHRSPSEGFLREKYPISELAKSYATYATAISVLTNKPFFGGSYEHLKIVSEATALPTLCKDIIVHPYQVALARFYQADAILLMLSVLDDDTYVACNNLAISYNMSVVTEVYTEEEMIRANKLKANIILVNQRCLHSMTMDKERIYKLATYFSKETLIIGASGIDTHQEVNTLRPLVDGYLIGSVLSKSNNIIQTMKDLVFGGVKVCGLTRLEDAQCAYDFGATYGGLIFAPDSPRKVSLREAQVIAQSPLQMVGVFANQPIDQIIDYAIKLNLTVIQLHGNESPDYILSLRQSLKSDCQIWLALDGNHTLPTQLPAAVDKLIIDNKTTYFGGTGSCFDWRALRNHPLVDKMMLSGGISSDNIIEAKKYNTWGFDINSSVEQTPGIKDKLKLAHFFKTLKTEGGRHANLFR